jgi:hypothetical protein
MHVHQVDAGLALNARNRSYDAMTADKWEIICTYMPKQKQTNIHSSVTADQQKGWLRCSALVRRADRSREWPAVWGKVSEIQYSL